MNDCLRQPATVPRSTVPVEAFIGRSLAVRRLLEMVDSVSRSNAPILITGECGTGKEILARRIHERSLRCQQAYVAVNCGAIAGSLEESELFGYVQGAFTGANRHKRGLFEAADEGTIFLDEIGEASPALQIKLLRVLQDGDFLPVGAAMARRCDVRMVAATNADLDRAIDDGSFRADLFYRLDVVRLCVPPLRERMEDIPLLVDHFVARHARHNRMTPPPVRTDFVNALLQRDYPGNVRELSNHVHRAVVMSAGKPLSAALLADCIQPTAAPSQVPATGVPPIHDVPPHLASVPFELPLHEARKQLVETFERQYLIAVLTECGGIVYRAAKRAGMSERGFHLKLRQYDINGTSFRRGI